MLRQFISNIICGFLMVFALSEMLQAQEEVFFDHLDVPQGLSSSNVRAICQDRYGYLWLATDDGLNRYDGYQFEVFKHDPSDTTSLPDSRIQSIAEGSQGELWVSTHGGLSKWDRNNNRFVNYDPLATSSVANDKWIWTIFEDSGHQMWVGTRFGGILSFDREAGTFRPVKLLYEDGVSRAFGGPVAAITETASGEIYSASFLDGIIKYNRQKDIFELIQLQGLSKSMFSEVGIFTFHEDKTGSLWVASQSGLYRIDADRESIQKIKLTQPESKGFVVFNILEDDQGYLWIGSNEGVFNYNLKTKAVKHFRASGSDPHSLSANSVWSSFRDEFGVIWFGTIGGGLSKFDPKKITFKTYTVDAGNEETTSNGISAITSITGEKEVYWLSTDNGVFRYDRQNDRYDKIKILDENITGSIRSIVADESGIIWLASQRSGIYRYDSRKQEITNYRADQIHQKGINFDNVYGLELDDFGNLWIGTTEGLNRLNPSSGNISRIPSMEGRNYRPALHTVVDSLYTKEKPIAFLRQPKDYDNLKQEFQVDQSSNVLIVSVGEGLRNFNMVDYGWLENSTGDTIWAMSNLRKTFHLSGATKNRIEIGILKLSTGSYTLHFKSDDSHTYGNWNESPPADSSWWGINVFPITENQAKRYAAMVQEDQNKPYIEGLDTRALEYSSRGFLWVGTQNGLSRYEIKSRQVRNYFHVPAKPNTLSSNVIINLLEDRDGILWIATPRGLNRLDPDNETITVYTEKDGLPSDQLRALAEDNAGNLWISSVNGLTKFEKTRNSEHPVFVNYDVQDGLQGYQFYFQSVYNSPAGELFFGGRNGFNAFFPGIINNTPPRVILSNLFISNQRATAGSDDSPLNESIFETESIVLSHDQNDLSFEFATIHFSRPDKNQVAHQFEGYQSKWVNNGRRFASYTNLDPGEYTFRVRGVSSDGILSKNERILHITIEKPWWNTTLAYISYGLIFIFGVFTIDRIQRIRLTQRERNRAKIREAELRAQVAEAENERKSLELEEARKLQLSLLPSKLPELPHLEIAVYMKTATEVGGDYYDYNIAADGTLNIVFGDAAGHGMRAGTVVTLMKGLFSADSGNIKIDNFLYRSSSTIKELHFGRVMMALTLIKLKDKNMLFSSAGMPPAYLYRREQNKVDEICLESVPLGAMKDCEYKIIQESFNTGDTLLLLSDGLPELKDPVGKIFDYPRVEQVFREVADKQPQNIIDHLVSAGESWRQDAPPEDDITFMVIQAR